MKYANNGLRVCWIFFKTALWELVTELISVIIIGNEVFYKNHTLCV